MDFITIGKFHYVGYCFAMSVAMDIHPFEHCFHKECYKVLFLEAGTLLIELNGNPIILTGTTVVCLNETDEIVIRNHANAVTSVLYFHPGVVNNKFTFDIIKQPTGLSITDSQDLSYLTNFIPAANSKSKILQLPEYEAMILKQRLQSIDNMLVYQDNPYWPCRSRSYLFEILFSLSCMEQEESSVATVLNCYSPLVGRIIYYLHSGYNQKITLETLCQEFHINRTTLVREFKETTGKSIHQYLMQLRLSMASTLLRDTELSVEEISDRCGFTDFGYFCKTFKKAICYTPNQYRQLHQQHSAS
jgi:AraC family L-rhamnose operon regulatory protein RhaS